MTTSNFDVKKWAAWQPPQAVIPATDKQPDPQNYDNNTRIADVESVISQLEAHRIDITGDYGAWLAMAFAFAHEFGEAGRGYFHRISRFHPDYSPTETDRQFDECLKRGRSGKTIRSFFWLAGLYGAKP